MSVCPHPLLSVSITHTHTHTHTHKPVIVHEISTIQLFKCSFPQLVTLKCSFLQLHSKMLISTGSHPQMFMSTAAITLKCSFLQPQSLSTVHFYSYRLYQLFISPTTVILKCSFLQPQSCSNVHFSSQLLSRVLAKGKNSHISQRKCRLLHAFIKFDPNLYFAAAIVHHLRFRCQGTVSVQGVSIKLGLHCLGCNNQQAYIQKYWPH